jgi:tetratricopeptide (TPR) repeat protein
MARLILGLLQMSTRSSELSELLSEVERLGGILARAGDVPGARLAEAAAAWLLFGMGRAGEAVRRAGALVDLGGGDENWRRQARQSWGASLVWGPTPVEEAISLIEAQQSVNPDVGANRGLSRLHALQGRFTEALELLAIARAAHEDLGNRHQVVSSISAEGEIQYQAGNLEEAARLIRESYDGMIATGDRSFASTVAAELADVLFDLHQEDEAWRYATIARDTSSSDDVISQAGGRAMQARIMSRRGEHDAAEALAREAVEIMADTDYLAQLAAVLVHQAKVLRESGKAGEAVVAAREAVALFERKGATFFVEQTQRLIDDWTA